MDRLRIAFLICACLPACSQTQVVEQKAPLPVVPEYVKIPHPAGFDLADLRAILVSPLAPKDVMGDFANTCDEEFRKLTTATTHKEERDTGANELVTLDPERMHWCFYGKISRLQEVLQSDSTWTTRQKQVLESFSFLSPIANAFMSVYHDSRYLRWAAQYYSKVSEWVFFKKLEPTPESSLLYTTGVKTEQEPWVNVQRDESRPDSVFAKYGISFQPAVAAAVNPLEVQPARVSATNAPAPALAPESVITPAPSNIPVSRTPATRRSSTPRTNEPPANADPAFPSDER